MSVTFKGVVTKFVAYAKDFKSAVLKAAEEAPVILGDIEKDAPEVEAVTNLLFPQAAAVEQTALAALEVIAQVVEDAGSAATTNGLSVSLDQSLIADVQKILPSLKAFAAKL